MKMLYVLWRVDEDEHMLTMLPGGFANKTTNELIELCLHREYAEQPEEMRKLFVAIATDPDHPDYLGYEMPLVFLVDPDHIEFPMT